MNTPNHQFQTQRLGQLQALADLGQKRLGPSLSHVLVPARLLIDADPWTIGIDVIIQEISTAAVVARVDLTSYPVDMDQALAIGDLYRLQIDPEILSNQELGILPLLPVRLENKGTTPKEPNHGVNQATELRFKWLLGSVTERALIEFLSELQNSQHNKHQSSQVKERQ